MTDSVIPSVIVDEFLVADGGQNSRFKPSRDLGQENPFVTELANGNFVVMFVSYETVQSASGPVENSVTKAKIYGPTGELVKDEFPLAGQSDQQSYAPDLTALSDGSFAVSWVSRVPWVSEIGGPGSIIEAAIFDASGTEITPGFLVSNQLESTIFGKKLTKQVPSITELADGNLAVAWSDYNTQKLKIIGKDGSTVTDEFALSGVTGAVEVEALQAGGLAVVSQVPESDSTHLALTILNADGSSTGIEAKSSPSGIFDFRPPLDLTELSGGDIVATYQERGFVNNYFSVSGKAVIFGADGAVKSELTVGTPTGETDFPYRVENLNVEPLPDGNFMLVWLSLNLLSPTDREFVGRVYAPDGSIVKDTFSISGFNDDDGENLISSVFTDHYEGLSADITSDGKLIITWTYRNDVKTKVIDLDGGPTPNRLPSFTTKDMEFVRPENVALDRTLEVRDLDGDTLDFSITGGADAASFVLDAQTGVLNFAATPDFEAPTDLDGDNLYEVEVTVSDGNGGSDVRQVKVNVIEAVSFDPNGPTPVDYEKILMGGQLSTLDSSSNESFFSSTKQRWIEDQGQNAQIRGSRVDDYIVAGSGQDFDVNGGSGSDIFQFKRGDQTIRVRDFEDGTDFFHLTGGLTYDDLNISSFTLNGTTTTKIRTDSGDQLILDNTDKSQIDQSDFWSGEQDGYDGPIISGSNSNWVRALSRSGEDMTFAITGGADEALFGINPVTGKVLTDGVTPGRYEVEVTVTDTSGRTDTELLTLTVQDPNPFLTLPTLDVAFDDYDNDFYGVFGSPVNGTSERDWIDVTRMRNATVDAGAGDDFVALGGAFSNPKIVYGGAGADVFMISDSRSTYHFMDFETGVDKIVLPNGTSVFDISSSTQTVLGQSATVLEVDQADLVFFGDPAKAAKASDVYELSMDIDSFGLYFLGEDGLVLTSDVYALAPENQTFVIDLEGFSLDSDPLTYRLSDDGTEDNALFDIDPNTGVLSFKDAPDFEENTPSYIYQYNIRAIVTDGTGAWTSVRVFVGVSDVFEELVGMPTPGDDIFTGSAGDDVIALLNGDDQYSGGAGRDNIKGQSGDDTLKGDDGQDTITGGAGDDEIFGDNEDDVLNGQTGNDSIEGGEGDDRIYGQSGRDSLKGDGGDDRINGGTGNDFILGDTGDDTLIGGLGDDRMLGDEGRDRLIGALGDDLLYGGDAADILSGGEGNDTLDGGKGNDRLIGGIGDDELDGGVANDTLAAGSGDDILDGRDGDDFLNGGLGDDSIRGGRGSDQIDGSQGNDTISGGEDADIFILSPRGAASNGDRDTITDLDFAEDELLIRAFNGNSETTVTSALELYSLNLSGMSVLDTGDSTLVSFDEGGQISQFELLGINDPSNMF